MRRVVQRGTWVYDEQVPALVEIFTEPVEPPETLEDPPCDEEGNTFYAEYSAPNGGRSQSWRFNSVEGAMAAAERVIGVIAWEARERP